jgi:pimeloyl-ACP methyl ester carboxylesterase
MSLPGQFLNVGGVRMFYHRRNDAGPAARTLVLLHGWMVSHWQWRHVIPTLAETYDVIALDLPGFGESDRPPHGDFHYDAPAFMDAVLGALDALGVEKATFCGQSMGGAIALYTAARRPERVERLVVSDPVSYPFPMPPEARLLLVPFLGGVLFRAFHSRTMIRRFMTRSVYYDASLASEEWIDYLWERVNRPGGYEAAHAAFQFIADPSVVSRAVRAVRAPTLIVWGENDRLFPSSLATRLQNDIGGSEVALISVCGHSPIEERPDEYLKVVAPFIALGGAHGSSGRAAAG